MPGDALALARAFRDRLGFRELYLADLDAITGGAPQRALREAIAGERPDVALWMDAGVATLGQARELLTDGAARVIVGLETLLPAPDPRAALERLVAMVEVAGAERPVPGRIRLTGTGAGQPDPPRDNRMLASAAEHDRIPPATRTAFSLDLRAGQPIAVDPALRALPPLAIAELAAGCGIETIIILDLARVGTGAGPDLSLVREIRRALPGIELVAGGGVSDAADLERLADAGADAALVGSALHHGSTAQGSILWMCGALTSDVTSPLADD
jgi:phosphoribosylformimino-5-aminoimidazole carboxamide ribotide isomerase